MIMGAGRTLEKAEQEVWLSLLGELKRGRWFIAAAAILALSIGVWIAVKAPKIYEANAVIAPKKSSGGGGVLSQLGGLGGMLSSQMGLATTGNERLAFTLSTREVIGRAITGQNLLPKLYPDRWDESKRAWKSTKGAGPPSLQKAIDRVREEVLRISINPKKEVINLSVTLPDSAAVAPLAEAFLNELNESIRGRVRKDAEVNKEYLEQQLASTSDPLLREKLQALIAGEIEKAMLVGSLAFDVLEPPVPPFERKGPNRKRMVAMAFSTGLIGSMALVLLFSRALALLAFFRKQKPT